jgi:hypothetical protein
VRVRVEAGGRLVVEQQFRGADQAQRQVQTPLLATGKGPDLLPRLPGQAGQRDHLVHVVGCRIVAGVAGDRLADRQVGLDRDVLQHQPDPLAQRPPVRPVAGIQAEHLDPSGVAGAEPLEDLQGGGLAGAVRPEQREDLPVLDGEARPARRLHRAVALAQPGHHHRVGPRPGRRRGLGQGRGHGHVRGLIGPVSGH